MHVLVLPSWYPNANNPLLGVFFREQAEFLAESGAKVGCIALNESSPRHLFSDTKAFGFSEKNVNGVYTVNLLYPAPNRWERLRSVVRRALFRRLFSAYVKKRGRPDIVHLHSFQYGELALWIKEHYGIDYVVTEHLSKFGTGALTPEQLKLARRVFRSSARNIAVSPGFKTMLEKMSGREFVYIPNGVDTGYFHPKRVQKRGFRFLNTAFLNANKNQRMLVRAFAEAFGSDENVELVIVGDGPEREVLRREIERTGMEERISLYGSAERDEVRRQMQSADAFVLSSLHETFGVVLIEAMSCGLPVIATKCGGPEAIVTDHRLGELVEIDEKSIAEGMRYLRSHTYDPEFIRAYVEKNFSAESVTEKLLEIYRDAGAAR